MWIKTENGDYVNMDHVSYVGCYFHYNNVNTYVLLEGNAECEIGDGDYRDEIIRNIISGTPVMEVR